MTDPGAGGRFLSAPPHLYPPPQDVDSGLPWWLGLRTILLAPTVRFIPNAASELRRITLPRTPVNRGWKSASAPSMCTVHTPSRCLSHTPRGVQGASQRYAPGLMTPVLPPPNLPL